MVGKKDVTVISVDISKKYGPAAREAIAQDVMDAIVKRTVEKNVDKNGNKFPKYSKEYTKSLDFKNAGKSSNVNLQLSGDMLATIDLVSSKAGELRIGYGRGHEERGKAEGNILGTYGQKSSTGKVRDFLGLSDKELNTILKKYPVDNKEQLKENITETLETKSFAERLAEAISIKATNE